MLDLKQKKDSTVSSFLAHSLVGITIANQEQHKGVKEVIFISLFFMVMASSPDIDYLINYLRGESMLIRYTHSVGYVVLVTLVALILRVTLLKSWLKSLPFWLFFIAPASHLLLDFCVGVYGNPYFYPFSEELFVSTLGFLPSSGRIDFYNYYFWRNMGIELAIFIPIFLLLIPKLRATILKVIYLKGTLIFSFILGVVMGLSLDR